MRRLAAGAALGLGLACAVAAPARAQLTFPGASPISAGNLVVVAQPTLVQQTGGFQSSIGQGVLIYGASSRLALITESNLLVWNMENAAGGGKTARLSAAGLGDTLEEARYTVYQLDGIGSTFRIAPLVGLTIPTGMDSVNPQMPRDAQPGSGNWGGRVALTSSWQALYWNAEAEIGYDAYTPADATYQFGHQIVVDAAFHYVIWPRIVAANIPGELFASLESNFFASQDSRLAGQFVPGTGGQLWLVDPGLDWSTPRYGIAITALLPVMQTNSGTGRRYNYGLLLHFRLSLYTPHHW